MILKCYGGPNDGQLINMDDGLSHIVLVAPGTQRPVVYARFQVRFLTGRTVEVLRLADTSSGSPDLLRRVAYDYFCPECKAGKHDNCDGTAWDDQADEETACPCSTTITHHPKKETNS